MATVLYHPLYGYYTAGSHKIGSTGDFITAPELGPLFAYGLARQIQPILLKHPDFCLLEFGAGTGILAINLLLELDKLNCLPREYYILDLSAELIDRQKQTAKQLPKNLSEKIFWLNTLPEDNSFEGIILANEVVDAMPVNLFHIENNKISELGLTLINNDLVWKEHKPDNYLLNYIQQNILPIIPDKTQSYISEVNLLAQDWLASISQCLAQGTIIIIDYGFKRQEYYHHDRNQGTLMCHYRHFAHQDPLLYPGLQDITAHVDFTSLAETALENNLEVASFLTQAHFLLANNILDYFEINNNITEQNVFSLKQQLKKLTSPSEMGELFKVLILNKNIEYSFFSDLQIYDRRYEL
ncbi:MAG: SAM-dependent methyltransferase [Gammaproteobacteria bacterium]|nr:SAM-dependent methyltransferase [Gammaproteobacteria bacterium]